MAATPKPRNAFEERVAATLGSEYEYEAHKFTYTTTHRYTPDWVDVATKTIVEAKGFWRNEDRAKMKKIKLDNPDWTIKMVFQDASRKISKSSSTSYSDWCEKHGLLWEEGPKAPPKTKKASKK